MGPTTRPVCFRDFDPSWIVAEDEDLVVVAKPWGVPTQSADPAHPDDVVFRLERHLEARDGARIALGIHQRLDRETSGVLVLSKSAAARKSLAAAFEGRAVRKEYVAVVERFRGSAATLRDFLTDPIEGHVRVVAPEDTRGREAITHVRVLERRGDRVLLGLVIETGRTHQIRAQLAHAGAPILGDRLYGGPAAPRLLLHALSLSIPHPHRGEVTYRTRVPQVFKRVLAGERSVPLHDREALADALARASASRFGLAHAAEDDRAIDAFRLLHGEGDGVPGLVVDVYGRHLVAQLYGDDAVAAESTIVDALDDLGFDGIYVKRRPKQANELVETRRDDLAPTRAVRGRDAPDELEMREHGVRHLVRLGDGLSTGIFLDQRDNRRRLLESAQGARVLNLFAYTCAFSTVAAAGGAQHVVSVDASKVALAHGMRSFALGGYAATHETIAADCFEVLDAYARSDVRFDRIVCDPPTYSTTRRGRWTSREGWIDLAGSVLDVLAPSGVALLTSNDHRMTEARFRKYVHAAAERRGLSIRIRSYEPPRDFPTPIAGVPHLKTLWISR